MDIPLYNRQTKTIEKEIIFESWFMLAVYGNPFGVAVLAKLFKQAWFSRLYAVLQRRESTKPKILRMIRNNAINVDEFEQEVTSFSCFNDFFIRRLKPSARPIDKRTNHLISPADSRLLAFPILHEAVIPVKGKAFGLTRLLQDERLANQYLNGICLVFRLAVADYHRFCYIDNGRQSQIYPIKGCLHSVHAVVIRAGLSPFIENFREYCILHTENFGEVIHIDVGGLIAGKINQHYRQASLVEKGQEKGYFEFGGSTIIQLFRPNTINMDNDILEYSAKGIEALVKYGEKIGCATGVGLKDAKNVES